jgi:chorismate mutase
MAEKRAVNDAATEGECRADDPPAAAPASSQAGNPEVAARIDALRRRIDDLDEQLVKLLSARASCALQVGIEKKLLGLDLYQPSREADVLAHVQQINPGPLNDAAIKRLFERIIDEARRLEREAEVKKQTGQSDEQIAEG